MPGPQPHLDGALQWHGAVPCTCPPPRLPHVVLLSRPAPGLPSSASPFAPSGQPGLPQCWGPQDSSCTQPLTAPELESGGLPVACSSWGHSLGVGNVLYWHRRRGACPCVVTCVSGGWFAGLAQCPRLIVGFGSDWGGGTGWPPQRWQTDGEITGLACSLLAQALTRPPPMPIPASCTRPVEGALGGGWSWASCSCPELQTIPAASTQQGGGPAVGK